MLSRRVSLPKCISPSGTSKDAASKRNSIAKPTETPSSPVANATNEAELPAPLSVSVPSAALSPMKDPQLKDCAIKVVVRVRPLSEKELLARSPVVVNVSKTSVQVINPALFTDPTFLDAISTPSRKYSAVNLPVSLSGSAITAANQAGECRSFHFDRCFGVDNAAANESEPFANAYDIDVATQRPNQELVFEEIGKDMIPSAFQGFNCTVFAYGQTGSGKTHTMVGEKSTMRGKGVIPRVCEALFQGIDARRVKENELADELEAATATAMDADALSPPVAPTKAAKKTVFTVHMSYCEIYKEKVHDLLDNAPATLTPTSSFSVSASTTSAMMSDTTAPVSPVGSSSGGQRGKVLKVREHPVTGPFVEGLSSRLVNSYEEISEEMLAGDKLRTVAATLMNPVSSRSHAMFTLTLTQTTFDGVTNVPTVKTSKIALIDLAGSERANVSGTSGDRLKEGAMINKSLTTLGRVIAALSKTSATSNERVPYRDSTLTWLLKESLGGNAKTTMIAMVSPAAENYDETMSTLRYAESAKRVMNRAVVNEDPNARIIRQLRDEIQVLRDQLATREREAFYLAENLKDNTKLPPSVQDRDEFYNEMQDEMQNYKGQVEALLQKQAQHEEFLNKTSRVVRLHAEYPSLLNVKATVSIGGDDVLTCTLREGVTLVGSEEPQPLPVQVPGSDGTSAKVSSPDGVSTGADGESKSPRPLARKTSWAGSFLKRRKSSTSSLATDAPGSVTEEGRAVSPRKGRLLTRRSSRDVVSPEAEPEEPTSFVRLVSTVTEGEDAVLPKHALLIVHSRVVQPPSGDELTVTVEDEIEYVVELQPVSAATAVFVNDNCVAEDTRKRVVHGDVIGFGTGHRFRLHVPQVAAKLAAMEASKPRVLSIETQPLIVPLEDLVAEANAICDKWQWHLRMELAVSTTPKETEEALQAEVLVKKHLGGRRYTILKWSRTTLEEKLVDLRQLAASLEPAEGQEAAILEDEPEELVAIRDIEAPDAKISAARNADRVGDDGDDSDREESHDDSRSTQTRAVPASMSYMDGRYSTTIETTTAPGGHITSTPTTIQHAVLPPTQCVRQLGTSRVYLSGLLGSNTAADAQSQTTIRQDGVALSTAVYDSKGTQIARLLCHVRVVHDNAASVQPQGTRSDGDATGNPPPKRGFSFLSPRSSQTSAAAPAIQASRPTLARVQVVVERVEFTTASAASQQISLTLKKWSVSDATPAETDATGAGPGVESTPKVSAVQSAASHEASFPINHTMQLTSVASDDFLSVEVWGYGDVPVSQLSPSSSPALAHKIELFVSVDIEERDADGFFRPVAVKSDGTLRLHVNQPRRVSLRITQADHGPLVLQDFCVARLSPPFSTRGATNLVIGDGKSTQSLLLPPPLLVAHGVAASSARSAATTEADELPTFKEWLRLFPRASAELDTTSRSLSVSLRWEHGTKDPHSEVCDSEDARSVFRLAVAFKTTLSRVPVVVSKSIVTKLSTTSVTSSQRLAREWENSRTAWWARESFSRNYRLGTWYSVDVLLSSLHGENDVDPTVQAEEIDSNGEGVDTAMLEPPAAVAQVTNHINGLRRLELCFAMERVRQEIVTKYLTTRISDEYPLTLERAQECFEQLLAEDGHEDPPVIKVLQLDDSALYLRHKANKEIFIAVESGDAIEFSGEALSETAEPADHITHFVSEPTALTADATISNGGGGQMCGFLMFSTSVQLDESALVTPTSSVSPSSSSNPLSWARNSLSNRLSWERRWFVLKRPFLYAYKSFARKEQIGVLDVAKCQLVVPTSSSNAGSGRRPSLPGVVTRRGSKPDHPGQTPVASSGGAFPFCFQLVSMAGSKCVVWSLQASTQAEMRAWLVAIDPLKIEAREAVVNATPEATAAGLTA